jgi:hypothetical protein
MLSSVDRAKNTFAIYRQSARYLRRILTGDGTARSNERIRSEYATLQNDWQTLQTPCLVRTARGLDVVSLGDMRKVYASIVDEAIAIVGAKSILEFGCGDGLNIGLLRAKVSIKGFDLVPERVERARAYLASKNIPAELWVGDATQPQGHPVDLAYSVHAIEQMQDGWLQAFSQMRDAAPNVLVIEPFYERKSMHGKLHTRANGYFRGTIRQVEALGLKVVREFDVPYQDPFNTSTALLLRRQ